MASSERDVISGVIRMPTTMPAASTVKPPMLGKSGLDDRGQTS